jgi:hypothetical protein
VPAFDGGTGTPSWPELPAAATVPPSKLFSTIRVTYFGKGLYMAACPLGLRRVPLKTQQGLFFFFFFFFFFFLFLFFFQ